MLIATLSALLLLPTSIAQACDDTSRTGCTADPSLEGALVDALEAGPVTRVDLSVDGWDWAVSSTGATGTTVVSGATFKGGGKVTKIVVSSGGLDYAASGWKSGGKVTKIVVSSGGLDYAVGGGDPKSNLGGVAAELAAAVAETGGSITGIEVDGVAVKFDFETAIKLGSDKAVDLLAEALVLAFSKGGKVTKIVVSSGGLDY